MVEQQRLNKAKEEILHRIKAALQDVPIDEQPKDVVVSREYHKKGNGKREDIIALFAQRVSEYEAKVFRINSSQLKEKIYESCTREHVVKLVIPSGIPKNLLPGGVEFLRDDDSQPLTYQELDTSNGVLTYCALAVAQTGTIFLDGGIGQGRRALTLLPDYHLCIVKESLIVEIFPEAIAYFESSVKKNNTALTLISGPSATSDIELSRVKGVHGPRRLEVLIVAE